MKPGRPAKNYVNLHVQMSSESRQHLDAISKALQLSCGDTITYLIRELYMSTFPTVGDIENLKAQRDRLAAESSKSQKEQQHLEAQIRLAETVFRRECGENI